MLFETMSLKKGTYEGLIIYDADTNAMQIYDTDTNAMQKYNADTNTMLTYEEMRRNGYKIHFPL